MGLRDLLVVVDAGKASEARLELAVSLAAEHAAHLTGLFILPLPEPSRYESPDLVDTLIALCIREEREEARDARAVFETMVNRYGVAGEWRTGGGFASREATLHARYCDLAIVGQAASDLADQTMPPLQPEELVLGSGRPVLVTPHSWKPGKVGRHILLAWNARREAARAANDALPLLSRADAVTVVVVNPEPWVLPPHGEQPGADIALHLARHSVKSNVLVAEVPGAETGAVLRSKCRELGADLLVMGAYGHSRTRERVLGGVTRDILARMEIPVLMSH